MRHAIDPWDQPSLPIVAQGARFPVRRIFCVGRNYSEHVREMGGDPDREAPFFFMKPADALVESGAAVPYPPRTADLHHEIELVAVLGAGGTNIPEDRALDRVFGYAVGLDLTRRDLQGEAKQARRPWEAGKAFEGSAPCGVITPATDLGLPATGLGLPATGLGLPANGSGLPASGSGLPASGRIWLAVNGERRQDGDLAQMTWSLPEVIAQLSTLFTLKPGDLIFTGTPSGVGPVGPGDRLEGGVDSLEDLRIEITDPL